MITWKWTSCMINIYLLAFEVLFQVMSLVFRDQKSQFVGWNQFHGYIIFIYPGDSRIWTLLPGNVMVCGEERPCLHCCIHSSSTNYGGWNWLLHPPWTALPWKVLAWIQSSSSTDCIHLSLQTKYIVISLPCPVFWGLFLWFQASTYFCGERARRPMVLRPKQQKKMANIRCNCKLFD